MDYEIAVELKRLQAALGLQARYTAEVLAETAAGNVLVMEALVALGKSESEISALYRGQRAAALKEARNILVDLANSSANGAANRGEDWWNQPRPPGDPTSN